MPYTLHALKVTENSFVLQGNGVRLRGQVWRGTMKGIFWAIKCLETPARRDHLLSFFEVKAPQFFAGQKNSGAERRFVVFRPTNGGPETVLKFDGAVPSDVIDDWQRAVAPPALEPSGAEGESDEERGRTDQAEAGQQRGQHLLGGGGGQAAARRNHRVRGRQGQVAPAAAKKASRKKKPKPTRKGASRGLRPRQ